MAFLGDLVMRLRAETADFQSDLGKATHMAEQNFKRMERAAMSLQGVLVAAVGVASLEGVRELAKHTIELGDNFNKMSQKVGIGVEALSGLAYAAELSDLPLQQMQVGLKKLSTAMVEASAGSKEQQNVFRAIGVQYKETAGSLRAPEAALLDVADKFKNMKDGAEKSALAVKLFGKSGLEMIPMLNMGSEAIRKLMDEAKEFGVVWSKGAAQGAEDFNDNMKRLKAMNEGLVVSLVSSLLPTLLKVQEAFIESKKQSGSFYNQLKDMFNDRNKVESWAMDVGEAFAKVGDAAYTTWNTIALGIEVATAAAAKAVSILSKLTLLSPHGKLADMASGGAISKGGEYADALSGTAADSAARRASEMANRTSFSDRFAQTRAEWQKRSALEQIYGSGGASSAAGGKGVPDLSGLKGGLSPEQELKKFISAQQALEKEYFKLQGLGDVAAITYETQKGSLRELTGEHKKELIALAKKVEAYKTEIIMRTQAHEGAKAQLEMMQKEKDELESFNIQSKEAHEQRAFELDLMGKTQRQQELLNASRQVDLDLRKQIAALPVVDADGNSSPAAMEQLIKAAEQRKKILQQDVVTRQNVERDFATGAKEAFNTYAESAMNAAQNANTFFTNAFKSMEDALTNFVMTGKLDFKSLATSIIADLVRIQIRASITGPLAKIASESSGGLIGAGLKWLGSSFATGTDYVPHDMIAQIHQGERIIPASENVGMNNAGGPVFNVDMRGASLEAVQRLQAFVMQMNGSIESRALGAVQGAAKRGNRV